MGGVSDPFAARSRDLRRPSPTVRSSPLDRLAGGAPSSHGCRTRVKILLENLLRRAGTRDVSDDDVRALARGPQPPTADLAFMPARVLMQDFTGVPAVVDLAAMRSAMARAGGDPSTVNPLVRRGPDHRSLGAGRPVPARRTRTRRTSSGSTGATASGTRSCDGPSRRSTASASCRPAPGSAIR